MPIPKKMWDLFMLQMLERKGIDITDKLIEDCKIE